MGAVPKKPAAQTQAEAPGARVVVFAGQSVQLKAPELEKEPWGQSVALTELNGQKEPAGQRTGAAEKQ